MAQRTLKEQLEEAEQHSKEVLDQLLDENTTRDEFRTLMKSYVGYRFFLEPEEMKTDVILDLAEDSVEKLLSINDLSVTLSEGSQTCTNQSSTDIKKVLLSLTLQRARESSSRPRSLPVWIRSTSSPARFSMRRVIRRA